MLCLSFFFFFNDTATTEIYTLSLHDALPIYIWKCSDEMVMAFVTFEPPDGYDQGMFLGIYRFNQWYSSSVWHNGDLFCWQRSEEHTSELQSQSNLVCRLLLEKKKKKIKQYKN